jgi:hypothetical protein
LDEKIPKGMFLIEKWLSAATGMYDMSERKVVENWRRIVELREDGGADDSRG